MQQQQQLFFRGEEGEKWISARGKAKLLGRRQVPA